MRNRRIVGTTLVALGVAIATNAVLGPMRFGHTPRRCLLGDRPCTPDHACAAHRRWAQIHGAHDQALASTTIADLLDA